jgi:hypothetical protein
MIRWIVTGSPLTLSDNGPAAPYPCRCTEHGRAECGKSGWPPPNGTEGGCPCWGRPDAYRLRDCCGRFWRPPAPRPAIVRPANDEDED